MNDQINLSHKLTEVRRNFQKCQRAAFALIVILFLIIILNLVQYPRWLTQNKEFKLPTASFKFPVQNPYDHVHQKLPSFVEFKKTFAGWKLIGFDRAAVSLAQPSEFTLGYLGAASTRIVAYDPTLTEQELSALSRIIGPSYTARRKWFAVIVPPLSADLSTNGTVIVLRDSAGKLFFTPLSLAPKRFQVLYNAQ